MTNFNSKTSNGMKKILLMVAGVILSAPFFVSAQTATSIGQNTQDTQICIDLQNNMSQVAHSSGADVGILQDFIISQNEGSFAQSLASIITALKADAVAHGVPYVPYFGSATRKAVREWQLAIDVGAYATQPFTTTTLTNGLGGIGNISLRAIREITCGGTITTPTTSQSIPQTTRTVTTTTPVATPTTATPSITVSYPNGKEVIRVGDKVTIKWSSNISPSAKVRIELYQKTLDGGYYGQDWFAETVNSGAYEWVVPTALSESNKYIIRIAYHQGENSVVDNSDNAFSIFGGSPVLVEVSPVSGYVGGSMRVTVDTKNSGVSESVKKIIVALEKDDSSSYIPANFSYAKDSQGRWYADYVVPTNAKPGSWVVRQVGLFDEKGVIKYYNYPYDINKTFTIASSIANTTQAIAPAVTIDSLIAPASVVSGGSVTVTWSAPNATACTLNTGSVSDSYSGTDPVSGSRLVGPITSPRTIWLDCRRGSEPMVSKSVLVNVTATVAFNIQTNWNLISFPPVSAYVSGASSAGYETDIINKITSAGNTKTIYVFDNTDSKWYFYTPTLADGGLAYATSKGYKYLDPQILKANISKFSIWVNSISTYSLNFSFNPNATPQNNLLNNGWNFVSIGNIVPMSADNFVAQSGKNIVTMWEWNPSTTRWGFWGNPAVLATKGLTLPQYATSKNYDVLTSIKPGMGYWINVNGNVDTVAPAAGAPVVAVPQNKSQLASVIDAFAQAPASTPAPAWAYTWTRNLEVNSPYADDVSALQTALIKEGVYAGDVTGGFYSQTYLSVKAFQVKYGIESTGFVGPITLAKLNELY